MTKDLEYYLSLKYPYTIEEEEENGEINFVLEIPDLPGCWAQGKGLGQARKNLEEAKRLWIEEGLKRKIEIPEPSKEFSGRILLRIPPVLHGQLNKQARKGGLSLNQFIRNLLEARINLSSLIERLNSMEKIVRDIEQQLSLQNRMKRHFTMTGLAGYYLGTSVGRTVGYYPAAIGTCFEEAGKAFIETDIQSFIGFRCDATLEKEKEEILTL